MDPNEIQSSGSTPLHGASFYNQYDTVKLLIEYGAKTDEKNFGGKSALEESTMTIVKKIIADSEEDKITCLLNKLLE